VPIETGVTTRCIAPAGGGGEASRSRPRCRAAGRGEARPVEWVELMCAVDDRRAKIGPDMTRRRREVRGIQPIGGYSADHMMRVPHPAIPSAPHLAAREAQASVSPTPFVADPGVISTDCTAILRLAILRLMSPG